MEKITRTDLILVYRALREILIEEINMELFYMSSVQH